MKTTIKTIYATGPQFYVMAGKDMDSETGDAFTLTARSLESAINEVASQKWPDYRWLNILHTQSQQGQGLAVRPTGEVIL